MAKLNNVWVVACGESIAELTCGAAKYGEKVTLVYAGDKNDAVNADKAYYLGELGETQSFAAYATAVAKFVSDAAPEMVLLDSGRDGKLLAAHIAANCGTSVLTDASDVCVDEKGVTTNKLVFGGAAVKTERSAKTSVVCVGPGVFAAEEIKPAGEVEEYLVETDARIKMVNKRRKETSSVNLASAKKIVGVGRGLPDEAALVQCKELAAAIGAEVGCSRPICEERNWMARELYIGVSGKFVQPDCYISIGISGQIQHVVGINKSGTIIAIDKNEAAPIFKSCDYGIVGDLTKIVPALQKLIEN